MPNTNLRYSGSINHHSRRKLLVPFIAIIIVAAVALGLYFLLKPNGDPQPIAIKQDNSQSSNSSNGNQTSKKNSKSKPINPGTTPQGGAVDNNGRSGGSSLPPASGWASSSTGKITLQTPTANSVLHSGDKLIGKSDTSTVGFVLLDDKVGQIASGRLNVVDGKFSGTLQFQAHAATGKLDIYSPNPNNGAEENFLAIPLKF